MSNPDPLAMSATLITEIYAAVPWLADTTVGAVTYKALDVVTPILPYPMGAPKPFGILRVPTHATVDDEDTQTAGSPAGQPNVYTLYYYDAAYVAKALQVTEERRCLQTYANLAAALKPADGSTIAGPSQFAEVLRVGMRQDPNGPFLLLGTEAWLGIAVDIALKEYY